VCWSRKSGRARGGGVVLLAGGPSLTEAPRHVGRARRESDLPSSLVKSRRSVALLNQQAWLEEVPRRRPGPSLVSSIRVRTQEPRKERPKERDARNLFGHDPGHGPEARSLRFACGQGLLVSAIRAFAHAAAPAHHRGPPRSAGRPNAPGPPHFAEPTAARLFGRLCRPPTGPSERRRQWRGPRRLNGSPRGPR